jgi:type I restriction enzyme S subunit
LRNYFKAIEPDVLAGIRGVTADNIDFKAFQQREIIIPTINKQNEFEEFCKQLDKSKSVIQKSLDETQILFDSLMQKYFG